MFRSVQIASLVFIAAVSLWAQTRPSFEVATVRPSAGPIPGVPAIFGQQRTEGDTLTARHMNLAEMIRRAYGLTPQELTGGPEWVQNSRYDVVAKAEAPATDAELWEMMQSLLEDRFQLKYHRDTRKVSGMALVVDEDGHKMSESEGGSNNLSLAGGVLTGSNVTMARLAQTLSGVMQRPVIDETGLERTYDFVVDPRGYATPGAPFNLQNLTITAMQEELGLKLKSQDLEIQVMVIDQIEPPSGN